MWSYSCWITRRAVRELLVVFHELFVDVTHPDRDGTAHVLVQSRQRETPFVEERSLLRAFVDFGIDEGAAIGSANSGMVLAPRRAVDDEQADVLADLRCGQPHAVGFAEREEACLRPVFPGRGNRVRYFRKGCATSANRK